MIIHKFPIKYGFTDIQVNQGAEVLSAGVDPEGQICVWVSRSPQRASLQLTIETVYTGEDYFTDKSKFIGTVAQNNLVYHVFAL
jgi:hypothetical protein